MSDTKALSLAAKAEVLRFIDDQPVSAWSVRMRFVEAARLRSAELLGAKLQDLRLELKGWVIQVHGKGARNRIAVIPGQALDALQTYLAQRGLGSLQNALPEAPMLPSTANAMTAIGYQALYEHVHGWICKAVAASELPNSPSVNCFFENDRRHSRCQLCSWPRPFVRIEPISMAFTE